MVLVSSLAEDSRIGICVVTVTFGVVMISILVHGMTVSPLLCCLDIVAGRTHPQAYELARGKLQVASATLEELDHMSHLHLSGSTCGLGFAADGEEPCDRLVPAGRSQPGGPREVAARHRRPPVAAGIRRRRADQRDDGV
jgi:NhaP-type Na+/H+ or K+/H+ antiporter